LIILIILNPFLYYFTFYFFDLSTFNFDHIFRLIPILILVPLRLHFHPILIGLIQDFHMDCQSTYIHLLSKLTEFVIL